MVAPGVLTLGSIGRTAKLAGPVSLRRGGQVLAVDLTAHADINRWGLAPAGQRYARLRLRISAVLVWCR